MELALFHGGVLVLRGKGGVEPHMNVKYSRTFQMVSEVERCKELLQGRKARCMNWT